MQEEDYIYGDLDNFTLDQRVEQVQEDNRELLKTIEKLEETAKKFQEEISELKKVNQNLERNISVLYKTAKVEVDRKGRQLTELRRELDNLKFRRNNKKDVNKTPDNQPNIESLLKENERSKAIIEQKNKIILSLTKELENTKREQLNRDDSLKRKVSNKEDDEELQNMLYKKRKLEQQLDDEKNNKRDREYKFHSKIHDNGRFRSSSKSRDMDKSNSKPHFDKKQSTSTFRRNRSGSREYRKSSVINKHSQFHDKKYENFRSRSRSKSPVINAKFNRRNSRPNDSKTSPHPEDNKVKMLQVCSRSSSINDKRYHKQNNDASAANAFERKYHNNPPCDDTKNICNNNPLSENSETLYNTCNKSELGLKYDKIKPDLRVPLDPEINDLEDGEIEIHCNYDIDSDEDRLLFKEKKLNQENLKKTSKCTKVLDLKTSSSTLKTKFQGVNEKFCNDRSKINLSTEKNKTNFLDLRINKTSTQQVVNKFVQSSNIEEKLNEEKKTKDTFQTATNDRSKNNPSMEINKTDSVASDLNKNSTKQIVNKFENSIKVEEKYPISKTSNFESKDTLKIISTNQNNSSVNKTDSIASDLHSNKNDTQQIMNKFVKSTKIKDNKTIQKYSISQTSNFLPKRAANDCSKNNSSLENNKTDSVSSGLDKNSTKQIVNKFVKSSKVEENKPIQKLLDTEVVTNKASDANKDNTNQIMNKFEKCRKWEQNHKKDDLKCSPNENLEQKNIFFEPTMKSTSTDDDEDKNVISEDDKRRRRKEDRERISVLKTAISECKQNIEILEHDIHSEDDSETGDEFSKTDISEYNIGTDKNDDTQQKNLVLKIIKKAKPINLKRDLNKKHTTKQISSDTKINISEDCIVSDNVNCKIDHIEKSTVIHNPKELNTCNESIDKNIASISIVNSEHNNDDASNCKVDLPTCTETIQMIETVKLSVKQSETEPSSSKYQTELISEENNSFVTETLQQTVFSLLDINLKENKIGVHAVGDMLQNFDGSVTNLESVISSNLELKNKTDIECKNVQIKEAPTSENMIENKITTEIQKENLTIENCNNVNQDQSMDNSRESASSKSGTPESLSKCPLKARRRRAIIRIT